MNDPTVDWDDSSMKSSYANLCNVISSREEVFLLFGTSRSWNDAEATVTVELHDRVILSPHTAKRLAALLNRVLSDHEARYATPDVLPGTRH